MVCLKYTCTLKLVLLGESSVGKSSIVTQFTTGTFHNNNATIGAAFTTKTIEWQDDNVMKIVNFEIWDTAGQERYRSLAPMYYRNTNVALIVFDICDENSIEKAQSWINELNSYICDQKYRNIIIKLVGNKIDLKKSKKLSLRWKDSSFVSAKTGEGINELFTGIAKEIPIEMFEEVESEGPKNTKDGKVKIKSEFLINNGCNC